MCQNDVEFQQIDMKISKKNVQVLERYGAGALARRKTNNLKFQQIKQITGKYRHLQFIHTNPQILYDF